MEFLILFLFYLVFILLCVVVICICFNTHSWKVLILGGAQICACLVPGRLQRAVQGVYNYLLHTRNRIFVVLHLILQVLVYAEYSWEIFGYCYDQGFTVCSLVMPYLLLTVNLGFFFLTCMEDPESGSEKREIQRELAHHDLDPPQKKPRRMRRAMHLALPKNDLLLLPPKY